MDSLPSLCSVLYMLGTAQTIKTYDNALLCSSRHADGSLLYIISDNQNTIMSADQVFQTTISRKDSDTVAVSFGDQIDTIYSDSEFRTQPGALLKEEGKPPLGFIQNIE